MDALEARLEAIEKLLLLSAKSVLTINDVAMLTGRSVGFLYELTCAKRIPHYKKGKNLYFKKTEIENWLCEEKVLTTDEIDNAAESYTAINRIKF